MFIKLFYFNLICNSYFRLVFNNYWLKITIIDSYLGLKIKFNRLNLLRCIIVIKLLC